MPQLTAPALHLEDLAGELAHLDGLAGDLAHLDDQVVELGQLGPSCPSSTAWPDRGGSTAWPAGYFLPSSALVGGSHLVKQPRTP
jgi:hypothetical protein